MTSEKDPVLLEDLLVLSLFVELDPHVEKGSEAKEYEGEIRDCKWLLQVLCIPRKEIQAIPAIATETVMVILIGCVLLNVLSNDQVAVESCRCKSENEDLLDHLEE